jgi:hypothetical protein
MKVMKTETNFRGKLVVAYLMAAVLCSAAAHAQNAGPDSPATSKPASTKVKKRDKSDAATAAYAKSKREKDYAKELGEEYQVKYTDHFYVLTNAEAGVIKDFLPRLERTYDAVDHFLTQLELPVKYPKEKLPVIFCKSREEFDGRCKQFTGHAGPAEAAGLYYRDPLNFSIFYDMSQVSFIKEKTAQAEQLRKEAAATKDRNAKRAKLREADWYVNRIALYQQDQNRSVVQHEVAHQLLFNLRFHKATADNPQWFVEGMATLFEPPPEKLGAGINLINQRRLGEVRDDIKKVTADGLKAFIGNPEGKGGAMLSNEGYARSWSLCYYLMKKKSKELPNYVALIRKRTQRQQITPEQDLKDFESCFGKVNETFSKKYIEFITKLPYRARQ